MRALEVPGGLAILPITGTQILYENSIVHQTYLHKEEFNEPFKRTLGYILLSHAEDGCFPVKDSERTLPVLFEDAENVVNLIRAAPKLFASSAIRSSRIMFYGLRGPIWSLQHINDYREDEITMKTYSFLLLKQLVDCLNA